MHLLEDFRFALVGDVRHGDQNIRHAKGEVHRAADSGNLFAGGAPVGEVAVGGDFERAEHGVVDVAAANHAERRGMIEEAGAGIQRDVLLAGVDQVAIFLARLGDLAHAEDAVFAVEEDVLAGRDVVRHQGRDTNAEIDVASLRQIARNAIGDSVSCERHGLPSLRCDHHILGYADDFDHMVDENSRACGHLRDRCRRREPARRLPRRRAWRPCTSAH